MLPLHLQCLLNDEVAIIVVDNAKSHISAHHQCVKRRNSEPSSSLLSTSSSNKKKNDGSRRVKRTCSDPPTRASRWESEAYPEKDDFSFKSRPSSLEGTTLHSVLSKPVRRLSIEDPDILAQLHDSLSSIEGLEDNSRNTAALLAKALESLDFYDEDTC